MTKAILTKDIMGRLINSARVRIQRVLERKDLPVHQSSLKEIIQQHPTKEIIVFPPGLGWWAHLFQRPQHLASALARQGLLVFYMEPELSKDVDGFHFLEDNLYLCRIPVETFSTLERPIVYTLTWNRKYLSAFNSPRILYDYLDELSAFDGSLSRLEKDHEWLIGNANLITVTARNLLEQIIEERADTLYCPNGVDYAHFARIRENPHPIPPGDIKPILIKSKPVIGYYGALARWFDFHLLKELATSRTDLSFVFIGPDFDGTLPPGLLDLPNVDWLGAKPYAELPGYLYWFDVATIPFVVNNITHATSPLKLFEYMAAGKPIVITPMQESMRYEGALIGENAEDFSNKIDLALKLKEDEDYLRSIDQVAQQNTWDVRGRQILDALYK